MEWNVGLKLFTEHSVMENDEQNFQFSSSLLRLPVFMANMWSLGMLTKIWAIWTWAIWKPWASWFQEQQVHKKFTTVNGSNSSDWCARPPLYIFWGTPTHLVLVFCNPWFLTVIPWGCKFLTPLKLS